MKSFPIADCQFPIFKRFQFTNPIYGDQQLIICIHHINRQLAIGIWQR